MDAILSPECQEIYFSKSDFLNADCAKHFLNKLIGFTIISLSLIVKFPQIVKIYQGKSGKGINLGSQATTAIGFSSQFSYSFLSNYPFGTYGDTVLSFVQTVVVVYLCLFYDGKRLQALIALIICFSGALIICSGFVPLYVLKNFNRMGFLMKFFGGSAQILTNYRNQSTGQLSFLSVFIGFCIATPKAITTLLLTKDLQLVAGASMSSCIQVTIMSQMYYYSRYKIEKVETKKTE